MYTYVCKRRIAIVLCNHLFAYNRMHYSVSIIFLGSFLMSARKNRTETFPKLFAAFSLAFGLAGCGGAGGGSNTPAITVAFVSEPPSSMATSGTASIAATVGNDAAGRGVTWSV